MEGPFAAAGRVTIVLPAGDPTVGGRRELLELEQEGFRAELGGEVRFSARDPGEGARWLLELDERHAEAPVTSWDPEARLVVSRARDGDGLLEALNLWRTVRRQGGGSVAAADCADREQAIQRVVDEVADTYPAFELRGLDWKAICGRHRDVVGAADDVLAALQTWVAELEDSHTWVWPRHANLPYVLRLTDSHARFEHVPADSAAHRAGVGPGWRLATLDDEAIDAATWLGRTAAPPHSRAYLAGRRLLAGPAGRERSLTAVDGRGSRVTWTEAPVSTTAVGPVTWRLLDSGAGYLRIAAWPDGRDVDEAIDSAFSELARCELLVVDLRHNPGGSLPLACRTRDRFLKAETTLGSIRYSSGGGELAPAAPLTAEPAADGRRWRGRLAVLTDELTFSSSEDFLLGLQGLDHVRVVGRPSGGGSGRPRFLRLLPGWHLTVSTALSYDRKGRCIEGSGIPVDVPVPAAEPPDGTGDRALRAAEAL